MSVTINIPSMDSLKPEYNKIRAIQALYAAIKQLAEGGGGGGGTSFSDLGFNSFDSSTSYSKGDVVEKDGTLYEFTTSHTGDWSDNDVQATSVEALIDEHYVKPSSGIPSTDLASAVQTSLGKANTALQASDITGLQSKVSIQTASGATLSASIDTYYRFTDSVSTLAITLPAPTDTTHITSIVFAMTTGASPAVTFTATAIGGTTPPIYAQDGFAIEASTTYEVNAIFNGVAWIVAAIKIGSTALT